MRFGSPAMVENAIDEVLSRIERSHFERHRLVGTSTPPKHPADTLAYRFDEWTPDGKTLVQTHAFIGDWEVAQAAWKALIQAKPNDRLTMRHGALVHAEQLWSDKYAKRA